LISLNGQIVKSLMLLLLRQLRRPFRVIFDHKKAQLFAGLFLWVELF